jgi:hypothetical protein
MEADLSADTGVAHPPGEENPTASILMPIIHDEPLEE